MSARGIYRGIVRGIAIVLLGIAAIVVLVTTRPVQTFSVKYVLNALNDKLVGDVHLDSFHATISGRISISDLLIVDDQADTVVFIDRVLINVDPWEIQKKHIHIERCELLGVRAYISADTNGRNNLTESISPDSPLAKSSDSTKPFAWEITLDKFLLEADRTTFDYDKSRILDLDEWFFRALGSYDGETLVYAITTECENTFDIESSGRVENLTGDLKIIAKADATVDSFLIAMLPEPINKLGTVKLEADGECKPDSLSTIFSVNSSEVGSVDGNISGTALDSTFACRGQIHLHNLKPSAITGDTINMFANGSVGFEKVSTGDWLNGWTLDVNLDSSQILDYEFTTALHVVTLDTTAQMDGTISSRGALAEFQINANGFDVETMSVYADVKFSHLVLQKFADNLPDSLGELNGSLTAEMKSINPERLDGVVNLNLVSADYGMYSVDSVIANVFLTGDSIAVDSLLLVADHMRLFGNGDLVLHESVDFSVDGSIPDLRELSPFLPKDSLYLDSLSGSAIFSIDGSADMTGDSLSNLQFWGQLSAESLRVPEYSVNSLSLNLGEFEFDKDHFSLDASVRGVSGFEQLVDSMWISAEGTFTEFSSQLNLWAKADTIAAQTDVDVIITEHSISLSLADMKLSAYGANWATEFPTTIYLADDKIEIDGFIFRSELGVIRATGYIQTDGEQDMVVELSGFQTSSLREFLEEKIPDATVNVRVQLSGTDEALRGDVTFIADSISFSGQAVADKVELFAVIEGDSAEIESYAIWYGDTLAKIHALVPARLNSEVGFVLLDSLPLSGKIKILKQPLDRLNPWMVFGTSLGGTLEADIQIQGTPADPEWSGSFAVRDGIYVDKRNGMNYKWILIDGNLYGDSLIVSNFRATSEGTLTGSGYAIMSFPYPERLNLNLKFDKFTAVNSRIQSAKLNGNIAVVGPFDSLNATGSIKVLEASYRITQTATKEIEEIDLESRLADLRGDTTEVKGFMLTKFYGGVSHRLFLEIPGNAWIRGQGINLELTGSLYLDKESGRDAFINGEISVKQGTVNYLGQELEVSQGTVRFDGPVDDPTLDIHAFKPRLKNEGYEIDVHLHGTVSNTQITVSGTGPNGELTQEECFQKLLGLDILGDSDAALRLEEAATSAATGQLTGVIGRAAGLDVFQYKTGEGGIGDISSGSLEVGTYVTDRIFIRVLQPIETLQSGQEVTVEYQFTKWLKLQAQQTGRETSAFDLLLQVEWR